LLVAVLYVVDRLVSQTADENIPSSVGMFQCCMLLSCSFSFILEIAIYIYFCHYFLYTTKYIKL